MSINYLQRKFKKDIFKEKDYTIYSNIISKDPITSETEKKKKNLILIACITILITIYALKIKLPWIEIDQETIKIDHAKGLIGTLLLYTYFNYFWNALIDIRKWNFSEEMINITNHMKYLKNLTSNLTYIENKMHNLKRKLDLAHIKYNFNAGFTELILHSNTFNKELTQKISSLKKSDKNINVLINFRIATFEIVIPGLLGTYGAYQVYSEIINFLSIPFHP